MVLTLLTITLLLTPILAQNTTKESTCVDGLKLFVARGTSEPITLNDGQGLTGTLTKNITDAIPNSHAEGILYPATHDNPSYFESNANGTALVRERVLQYGKDCPDGKMALVGYSQGAQIMSNNLCGMPAVWGVYTGYNPATELDKIMELASPMPEEAFDNVVAFIMFGDTTFTSQSTYNHGTYNNTGNGIFYRESTDQCQEWLGSRMRSYCDAGDPFCDVGPYVDVTIHVEYLDNYGKEALDFVVEQYKNGGKKDGQMGNTEGSQEEGDGETGNKPGESAASGIAVSMFGLVSFFAAAVMI